MLGKLLTAAARTAEARGPELKPCLSHGVSSKTAWQHSETMSQDLKITKGVWDIA